MMISRAKHRSSVEVCADCGASDPSWASINRGLLLCAECCSVHRSMGRHISHVKSLRQGTWPPSLLAMVQALTAQNVNSIWEHSLLDASAPKHLRKKPQPKDPLHPVKSEFILAKHLRLAYILRARRDEPPNELGRNLHSAVRSSSLDTAMRLLAQGADPNYYNQEKGTMCLHVACRAGQAAQAELLACWGAAPAARDHAGCTPADCARQGGHMELAERMTELVYEATDRMIYLLTGTKPEHAAGRHYIVPRAHDTHEMTDVAKAARGKLQLLPNHLFEELVMDIYDEIDRRETEAIWQTSASGLERCGVAFLPVNPALSAPRNQGRQKLARLSTTELHALLRDVLLDATRRQHIATLQPRGLTGPMNPLLSASHLKHISQMSDDEPLYDSVASDDDYAALAPIDLDMSNLLPRTGEAVASTYNPCLPTEHSTSEARRSPSQHSTPERHPEIETLKKELDNRDSTITELKNQLKNLQSIVEQLTKENSVLKTSSVEDDQSVTSLISTTDSVNVLEPSKSQERGKSLETEQLKDETDAKLTLKSTQRPLTTLTGLDRSLTQSVLEGACAADVVPSPDLVQRRAESVTRGIQDLWAAAREQRPRLPERAEAIRHAVRSLLALFPQTCAEPELSAVLSQLRAACAEVCAACAAPSPLHEVRAAAYDLAKATKTLVTHFQPAS
ncbi:ARF GTPase-activating protein Git isoform X2 [Pectinophora gossypiella]|uniref:ARF GTPase-activating protein Git isoform X2 n=1 Tax=Pectinophora gossypiella TaxID=13191 RepID=UPI00214F02E4|nr:ARF GTPase-activating protein Git isoform X2 [Pectinophora gossypiella]